jgi:hypothetical protein
VPKQQASRRFERSELVEHVWRQGAVDSALANPGEVARGYYSLGHDGGGLPQCVVEQFVDVGPVDVDAQVEPVNQRAGESLDVPIQRSVTTPTRSWRTATARAGIHRRYEQKIGRKHGMNARSADSDYAFLEWLTKTVQHLRAEFGNLVHEKHPAMRERNFARPKGVRAPADEGGR